MKKILLFILTPCLLVSCSNDQDDDLTVQCHLPTNIQFTEINHDAVLITWDDHNTTASFSIEYGLTDFLSGTGTVINSSETSQTITGLLANTTYDVYIKSICSPTNESMQTDRLSFTTLAPLVIPELLPNLSQLNLFSGDLNLLTPSIYTFEYDLSTTLFTDYAHKQRLIALPNGETMKHIDDGLPNFPNNTVIAKTFYYFNNEQNEALGKQIIETRILIKKNDLWEMGNYKWNTDQTDAVLDDLASTVVINYLDHNGDTKNINYQIPSSTDCFTCHSNNDIVIPIGPKLRALNFNNQLQDLIDSNALSNLTNTSSISSLPNWEDTSYTVEERTRAYFDMNCAHCHSPGGTCDEETSLDFRYETPFADTDIYAKRNLITSRTQTLANGYTMPLIGTTVLHPEGYTLIQEYIDSL